MFSSLDRFDIVLKPGPDGLQQVLQTDERTAAEIEREPELSTLFALIRVLEAKRMAKVGSPEPVVFYVARERPPAFLRRAIHAAGAYLAFGDALQLEGTEGVSDPLDTVLESAFVNLARAVAAEYRVGQTSDGLRAVENALAELSVNREEDEVAYWSAVVKLGSFAGEVIRASNGGQWQATYAGSLPLALSTRFRGEEATVNPLGKAIKRLANGKEESLVALVDLIRSEP